jgi:hypothetical protein
MARMAADGVLADYEIRNLQYGYEELRSLSHSPPSYISPHAMEYAVAAIEREYAALCRQATHLAKVLGVYPTQGYLIEKWDAWLSEHAALVVAYDRIKVEPAFTELFRPMRASRWRDAPTSLPVLETEPPSPRDTE